MPVVAALLYWLRLARRTIDPRLKRGHAGGFTVVAGAAVVTAVWIWQRPGGLADAYFWGEVAGVEAIYVMCCSLLVATRARVLEPWFGGLDRMYLWHKRTAIAGVALLVPHKLLLDAAPDEQAGPLGLALGVGSAIGLIVLVVVSVPRAARLLRLSYERWLSAHRMTGLFVAIGIVHGLLLDRVLASSVLLQVVFGVVGATGMAAYLYAELVMRRAAPAADYQVAVVTRPDDTSLELVLEPGGLPLTPRAGQFVFLAVGGPGAGREHPFSVAGTGPGGELRLLIRARGADTRRLHDQLRPGVPARVTGPYGMFDHTLGGDRQVWIAGGLGVVPFLAWLDDPASARHDAIDFFYSASSPADAHYLPEMTAAVGRIPGLRLHTVFTDSQPRLTAAAVVAAIDGRVADRHVFLCGPATMTEALNRGLRRYGVARDHLHAEQFSFR
ncbi:MAG TPA: ferredoxin reductase family protein [Pseudonocardia sp.]